MASVAVSTSFCSFTFCADSILMDAFSSPLVRRRPDAMLLHFSASSPHHE